MIKNLVAVHRLREVSCLYGFTRFEAAPTSADGELEDVQLAVHGAPIAQNADWLPAIEQFGEGVFVHFDEAAIAEWLEKAATRQRHDKLFSGYGHWSRRFTDKAPNYPGTAYVLLHSLSHALMSEIALDCGYPASSLKERVYALSGIGAAPSRFGILIYTATAGAQGTLGRLGGDRAPLCAYSSQRIGARRHLLQRSGLRRPRARRPQRRSRHPRRRVPRLPAHRGDELRDEESVSGSQSARADDGNGWLFVL